MSDEVYRVGQVSPQEIIAFTSGWIKGVSAALLALHPDIKVAPFPQHMLSELHYLSDLTKRAP